MSFDKKIYTCEICGRMDFSAERFVHVCPVTTIEYECLHDIDNFFGQTLFTEGKVYKCLEQKDRKIKLDHNLYGREYDYFDIDWVLENFKPLK